jgi:outer membrane protein, heavy metal efflux system
MQTLKPRWRRACRPIGTGLALMAFASAAITAAPEPTITDPYTADAPATAAPLTLPLAVSLALEDQPLLKAQDAQLRAAREAVVYAAQLPDPQLSFGVQDLPVNGDDAFSLRRDSDTQLMLGVSQALPRAAKRRLMGERAAAQARAETEMLGQTAQEIRRDVALAWLDVFRPERAQALVRAVEREADAQAQAADIAYRAGRITQADLIAARVDLDLAREEADDWAQQAAHARNALSRWIGPAATRPLPERLPELPAPEPYETVVERLQRHPHLAAAARGVEVAQAEVRLAQQGYRPDWSVDLGYGYRPDFSEMVMLKFGMDLPIFTGKRQDRVLAARVAELERAQSLRDDALRQHLAELRLNHADWRLLQGRLARFDRDILPQAEHRIAAARLAFESGRSELIEVLRARRALLEIRLQRLELEVDQARHLVQLQYLSAIDHASLQVSRHE